MILPLSSLLLRMLGFLLSRLFLICIAFWVFIRSGARLPSYTRLLWGFFILSFAFTALVALSPGSFSIVRAVHASLQRFEATVGMASLLSAAWLLIHYRYASRQQLSLAVGAGLVVYMVLLSPRMLPWVQIVPPLIGIAVLLVACLGLIRRQQNALWLLLAMMVFIGSLKLKASPESPQQAMAQSLLLCLCFWSIGKAIEVGKARLFG